MAVSFVVILPISVIIAATWRGTPNSSAWFQAHRSIGVSASTGPRLTSSCFSCPRVALETHHIAFKALLSVKKHEGNECLRFLSVEVGAMHGTACGLDGFPTEEHGDNQCQAISQHRFKRNVWHR